MDNQKIARRLIGLAKELVGAVSDEEFIADQLVNAWEFSSPDEMTRHLASETGYSRSQLKPLVNKWYDDVRLRMKVDMMSKSTFEAWILSELGG